MKLSLLTSNLIEESNKINVDGVANTSKPEDSIKVPIIYQKIFSIYSKIRNAVDNNDKEYVIRSFISRILKKLLKSYANPAFVSKGLVYKLIAGGYLSNGKNSGDLLTNIILKYQNLIASVSSPILTEFRVDETESYLFGHKLNDLVTDYLFLIVRENLSLKSEKGKGHLNMQIHIACLKSLFGDNTNKISYAILMKYIPDWEKLDGNNIIEQLHNFVRILSKDEEEEIEKNLEEKYGRVERDVIEKIKDIQNFKKILNDIENSIKDPLNESIARKIKDEAIFTLCIKEMLKMKIDIQNFQNDTIIDKIRQVVSDLVESKRAQYIIERVNTLRYIAITKMALILPAEYIYIRYTATESCVGYDAFWHYILMQPIFGFGSTTMLWVIGIAAIIWVFVDLFILYTSIWMPIVFVLFSFIFVSYRNIIYPFMIANISCNELGAIAFNAVFHPLLFFYLTRTREGEKSNSINKNRIVEGIVDTMQGVYKKIEIKNPSKFIVILTELLYIVTPIVIFTVMAFGLRKILPTVTTIVFMLLFSTVYYFTIQKRYKQRKMTVSLTVKESKKSLFTSAVNIAVGEIGSQLSGSLRSVNMFGKFMDGFVEKPFIWTGVQVSNAKLETYYFFRSTKKMIRNFINSVQDKIENFVSHVRDKDNNIR